MLEIIKFELGKALKKPGIYIYWSLFFLIGFFMMNVAGGAFSSMRMNIAGDAVHVNSPGVLDILFGSFTYLGIIVIAAITAPVAFRDFKSRTSELVFSTPIKRANYIYGRFFSAFFLNIIVFIGLGIGVYIGTLMPYLNKELFGEFQWSAYLNPYAVKVIPNLFFITAIFFCLTMLRRNVMINWLSIIGLYLLYAIGQRMLADLDTRTLAALLDPFGIASSVVVTASNSAQDMNSETVSVVDVYLYNRILWITIGVLVLLITQWRFSLKSHVRHFLKRSKRKVISYSPNYSQIVFGKKFPISNYNWTFKAHLNSFLSNFRMDLKWLFKNLFFWLIILFSIIFMFTTSQLIGRFYDTETYPVTYQVIYILNGTLNLFIYIVITLFSGEILWRDRALGIHEQVQSNYTVRLKQLWSKFTTICFGVLLMLGIMMLCGMFIQASRGYFDFEISLYLKHIFGVKLIDYILLVFMAFFLHILINNKYAGYVALLAFYLIKQYVLSPFAQHNLLVYGEGPMVQYSDMNGYGFDLPVYWIFKIYWLIVAGILFTIAANFWVDSSESNWKARLVRFKQKLTKKNKIAFTALFSMFILWGGWIFYNTNILNNFEGSATKKEQIVEYEKKYKQYENIAQPKIVELFIDADIQPEKKSLLVNGYYWLKNKTKESIKSIHLNYSEFINNVSFNREHKETLADNELGYFIYDLDKPLLPNDSVKLSFALRSVPKGFTNNGYQTIVNKNGTLFYNSYFPSVGYEREMELANNIDRKQKGLPERPRVRSIDDPEGIKYNFISKSADFIRFEAILRTSSNQTAVCPGKLISKTTENNKNIFHYKVERPMINYFAILSAEYEEYKSSWKPENDTLPEVELSILYHKKHNYNLEMMMDAMKTSLSYYNEVYTPYQFSQLRIVEFPRFGTFAQSFPNMIPYSEGIGFIADLRDMEKETSIAEQKINYPFWFIAHEIAHQWWAHQVIAADVEGAQMLMESVTQFTAYKVLEQKYGKEKMRKVFREEAFKYISNRKDENENERPLAYVANNQSSIYYQKGALSLYSINEYLGNDSLMAILKSFIKKYAFKAAPYPRSSDLIAMIKESTPDSLQFLVNDYFEKIALYDMEVANASYHRNPQLEYFVELEIYAKKVYADGNGREENANLNEKIPIAFYSSKGELVALEQVHLVDGKNNLNIKINRKPSKVVIDPYYQKMNKDFMRQEVDVELEEI